MSPIWLLTLAIATVGANSLALSPLAAEVGASFAIRAEDVLRAAALYGVATAVSALTFAHRADRIGLRRALVLALVVTTLGLVLTAGAQGMVMLSAGQMLAGLGAGTALPVIYALAAELAPEGRESETLGKVLMGWTLSLVAGVTLAAILADIVHWRWVFGVMAALTAGLALVLLPTAKGAPRATRASSPLTALKVPGIVPALANVVFFMAAFYGLYNYVGPHMTGTLGTSTTLAGMAALSYGLGFGAIAPLGGFIDRMGPKRAAPWAFGLLVLIYWGLAIAGAHLWLLLSACAVWGVANHVALNLIVGRLTALDPSQRGAVMGLYSATTYVAMFAGIFAMRPVFLMYGFGAAAVLAGLFVGPALFVALRDLRAR